MGWHLVLIEFQKNYVMTKCVDDASPLPAFVSVSSTVFVPAAASVVDFVDSSYHHHHHHSMGSNWT